VGLLLVPGHSGARGNEIADGLTREENVHLFLDRNRLWGSLDRKRERIFKAGLTTSAWQCGGILPVLKREARKLISGPSPTAKRRLMSLKEHNPGLLLAFLLDITL
jgi:hypothetical protein